MFGGMKTFKGPKKDTSVVFVLAKIDGCLDKRVAGAFSAQIVGHNKPP
jgi:hypothetical protein